MIFFTDGSETSASVTLMANNRALAAALGTITYVRRRRQSGQIVGALGLKFLNPQFKCCPYHRLDFFLGSPKITSLATLVK